VQQTVEGANQLSTVDKSPHLVCRSKIYETTNYLAPEQQQNAITNSAKMRRRPPTGSFVLTLEAIIRSSAPVG
jgi:hypothetical protein